MKAAHTDVVIVGAGAAGLSAARSLHQAGRSLILLEARDRCGGRIDTRPVSDLPIPLELGAEFVHGQHPEVSELVTASGARMTPVSPRHWSIREGHAAERSRLATELERWVEHVLAGDSTDCSFRESAERFWRSPDSEPVKRMAIAYVQGFNAADADRISARSVAASEAATHGGKFRLTAGYAELLAPLVREQEARLRRNTVVERIRWEPGSVVIEGHDRDGAIRVRGRMALITVPIGVLQAAPPTEGSLEILPEPVLHREAWNRLIMGQAVRMVVRFNHAFWLDPSLEANRGPASVREATFLHSPGAPFPTWWTNSGEGAPVLTGWAGGPAAQALIEKGAARWTQLALASLAEMLSIEPARLTDSFVQSYFHPWHQDPFSRGAYSYRTVDSDRAVAQLYEPIADTVHFAGEALAPDSQYGTVHGAIASGRLAACAIIERFHQLR